MSEARIPPSKETIAEMEPFAGLTLERISVVSGEAEAREALAELLTVEEVGFDTESKPTFHKGQKSDGPHVFQFSTMERAYIFQTYLEECREVLVELLASEVVTKVGFGLRGDLSQIQGRFGLRPASIVDLDRTFRNFGYRNAVGAKSAVAMLFGQRLTKSKSVTTSNWAQPRLTEKQLLYAANDAYAAIRVHQALKGWRPQGGFFTNRSAE